MGVSGRLGHRFVVRELCRRYVVLAVAVSLRILIPPCVPPGYYFQNVLAVAAGFNPYFDGFCIPCPLGTTSLKGNFVSETEGGVHGGRKLQTAFPTLQDNLVENVCNFCPRESPRLIFAVPPCVLLTADTHRPLPNLLPAGTYGTVDSTTGGSVCAPCPANQYNPSPGLVDQGSAAHCFACPSGYESGPGAVECLSTANTVPYVPGTGPAKGKPAAKEGKGPGAGKDGSGPGGRSLRLETEVAAF